MNDENDFNNFWTIIYNNSIPTDSGLGLLISNYASGVGEIYNKEFHKELSKILPGAKPSQTSNQALKALKEVVSSKSVENALKELTAKTWETAAEKLSTLGNNPAALSKLNKGLYNSVLNSMANNEKDIAKAMSMMSQMQSKFHFVAKHIGPLAAAIDLGMAIRSDDLNTATKAAVMTGVGMAVGKILAAGSTIPIFIPIIAVVGVTASIAYVWDRYNIGEKLGIAGKSLSDSFFEAIDSIDDIVNYLSYRYEEISEEIITEMKNNISESIDILLNGDIDWSYFDDFIIDGGKALWDSIWNDKDIAAYSGENRTKEYHQVDPLSLDLDGDGIETVKIEGLDSVLFDHDADGIRTATGWIAADDGLLVLDRNGNGLIDSGRELFGDNTLLKDGSLASSGFAALAEFDENQDGKIDAQDAVYAQLRVWRDMNQDGISQADELFSLEALGIQSLDLNHQNLNQRQSDGNTLARLGSYSDAQGQAQKMGDFLLAHNGMISRFSDEIDLNSADKQAVNLRGMGRLRDLQSAAAMGRSNLKAVIEAYTHAKTKQEQMALRDDLLLEWAKTDIRPIFVSTLEQVSIRSNSGNGTGLTPVQIKALGIGSGAEASGPRLISDEERAIREEFRLLADKIKILDAMTGLNSSTLAYADLNDAKRIIDTIKKSYDSLADKLYAGLLFQTRLKPYTEQLGFQFKEGKLAFDFTQMAAAFNQVHAQDPQKAFIDLAELLYYSNATQKPDTFSALSSLLMQYAQEAILIGQLENDLAILGAEIFTALGHHLGTEASETLKGTDLFNLMHGDAGDDKLYAYAGDDRLIGGAGNDYLNGGYGNDTYIFAKGHGQDVITDYETTANTDRIIFSDIQRAEAIFRQEGYHLIIQTSAEDSVKIEYFFSDNAHKIEIFQFADQTFSLEELMANGLTLHGTESNDSYQYWQGKGIVYAGAGDDVLRGADKDDELYGEAGDDKLYGNNGNDILNGGAGNDRLEGGYGNDTYVFAKGHGQDVITDYETTANSDRIIFSDIQRAEAIFRQEGTHLIIQTSAEDSVKIEYFFSDNAHKIEIFQFADQTFSLEELMENGLTLHGTESNDSYQYWQGKGIVYAGAGDDVLRGADKDDELHGEAGDDKLYGNNGNDILNGGAGNDRLEGGYGNDTYVFAKGHGQDVIYDYETTANTDRIVFNDIQRAEAIFRQEGYHLIIQTSAEDSVKIQDFFYSNTYKIEVFQFADQTFSLEELMENGLTLHGTESNDNYQYWQGKGIVYAGAGDDVLRGADKDDELYGEAGDDKLYGNGGNDRLYGGAGADYLYAGAGNDWLNGGQGADRLHGGAGADVFVFDVLDGSIDTIEDFHVQEDKIALSKSAFTALGDSLSAETFALGSQATSEEQRILFDSKTGSLLYDADGSGAAEAQVFATIRGSALNSLSHEQFVLV